jgi:hypothetical protein
MYSVTPPSRMFVGWDVALQAIDVVDDVAALAVAAASSTTAITMNHFRKSAISFSLVEFEFELVEVSL